MTTPWAPLDWRISSCKLTSNIFVFACSLTLTVSQPVECNTGQSEWTNTIASPSHKSYLWFCTIAKIQLPLNHTLHYHIIAKHNPARRPSHHRHHQSCSLSHRQSALLTINTSFKPFLPTQPPSPQTSTITFHPLKIGKLCLLRPCRGGYFNILYSGARRNPGHYRIS